MKKYKMLFTEKECELLDAMCSHCLINKERFSYSKTTVETLNMMQDFRLKIKNAIEVT